MSNPGIGPATHASRMPHPCHDWWKRSARLALTVLACAFAGAGQAQTVYRGGLDDAVGELVRTLVNEAGLHDKRVLVQSEDFFELGTELRLELSEMLQGRSVAELTSRGVSVAMAGSDEDAVRVLHGRWRREPGGHLYLELFVAAPVTVGDPTALKSVRGLVPIDESIREAIEATRDDWGRLLVLRLERGVRDPGKLTVHLQPMTIEGDGAQGGRLKQYLKNWLGNALVGSRLFTLVEPPPGVDVETDGKLYVEATVHEGHVEVSLRVVDNGYRRVTFATVGLDEKLFPPDSDFFGPDVTAELAKCAGLVDAGNLEGAKECYEGVRAGAPGDARVGEEVRAGLERVAGLERKAGRRFRDCAECPELVVVPSGSFLMGSPSGEAGRGDDEGPVHRVRIARPFAVGVKEVTRGEYGRFVSEKGRSMGDSCRVYEGGEWKDGSGRNWKSPGYGQTDDHPVVCVSWNDAKAYVDWLSGETREAYRLLSEAEWEYVARGGTRTARYWGESETGQCGNANGADREAKRHNSGWTVANCDDGYYQTAPVGSFAPNEYKLHDVLGNVWEWVEDCWNESYAGAPSDGSVWESGGCSRRVVRGGSWGSHPRNLRSADRFGNSAGFRYSGYGFRIARTLTP